MSEKYKEVTLAEGNPFIPLRDASGIYVVRDINTDIYGIILDPSVPYPKVDKDTPLADMLLDQVEGEPDNMYQLPQNFITMGQVLNDAIGMHFSERGIAVGRMVFEELGRGLAKVAFEQSLSPIQLNYKNVIFSREAEGAKLLPPIEFSPITRDSSEERSRVIGQLRSSCESGAANRPQQELLNVVFTGFEEAYNW